MRVEGRLEDGGINNSFYWRLQELIPCEPWTLQGWVQTHYGAEFPTRAQKRSSWTVLGPGFSRREGEKVSGTRKLEILARE